MARKKWTPQNDVTIELVKFREKRKWQLALRRYILNRQMSATYAPYFGLDNKKFREWIEIQFDSEMNWESFAKTWQFDHIIPVNYFDFSNKADLYLCWNFINIRVEKLNATKTKVNKIDLILAVKPYFKKLYEQTGYILCQKMLEKIDKLDGFDILFFKTAADFINVNKEEINIMSSFNEKDFFKLNAGISLKYIILEKEILRKFSV